VPGKALGTDAGFCGGAGHMNKPMKGRPNRLPRRSALTLLELVVVVAILAALAGMAVPLYENTTSQSQIGVTNETLRRLQDVILNTYVPNMKGADISSGLSSLPIVNLDGLPRSTQSGQPSITWLFQNPASQFGAVASLAQSFNRVSRLGWNGPYLTNSAATYPGINSNAASAGFNSTYGNVGDPAVLDGWGNPIVIVYVHDPSQTGLYANYFALLSAGPSGSVASFTETGIGTPQLTVSTTTSSGVTTRSLVAPDGVTTFNYWLPLPTFPMSL
jgi:type II secretory pathway pseudopilin PulG